jgi:hypothetical protein
VAATVPGERDDLIEGHRLPLGPRPRERRLAEVLAKDRHVVIVHLGHLRATSQTVLFTERVDGRE